MALKSAKTIAIGMSACALLVVAFMFTNLAHSEPSVVDLSPKQLINLFDKRLQDERGEAESTADLNSTQRAFILIDVRTPTEFKAGHVRTAVNIPHADILDNISLLDPYLEKDMIFYCHSGARAGKVTRYLTELEYKGLYHLKGDFMGWQASKLEIAQ